MGVYLRILILYGTWPIYEVQAAFYKLLQSNIVKTYIWVRVWTNYKPLHVPKSTLGSITVKGKKLDIIRMLPRAGHLANFSSQFNRQCNGAAEVIHIDGRTCQKDNYLRNTFNQALMIEWQDGSYSWLKGIWVAFKGLSEHFLSDETKM